MAVEDLTPVFETIPASISVVVPPTPSEAGPTTFGGFMMSPNGMTQGSFAISGTSETMIVGQASAPMVGKGIFVGNDGTGVYHFRIGDPSGDYMHWDGTKLSTNKFVLTGIGAFGGDGSDGALNVPSGTTTINLANSAFVIKNYTSINIAVGATVNFSNPGPNGSVILLKCQGDATIAGTIDGVGTGAPGAAANTSAADTTGNTGTIGNSTSVSFINTNAGLGGTPAAGGLAGALPTLAINVLSWESISYLLHYKDLWTGSGGGAGGTHTGGAPATGGAGGAGAGCLIIEVAGAMNFSGSILLKGTNGSDGVGQGASHSGGGGGGGAGGYLLVLYNTLTANSGGISVFGGIGGAISSFGGRSVGAGGGGSNAVAAGGTGAIGTSGNGGNGADGTYLFTQNKYLA